MDYKKDIKKFVIVEFLRENAPTVAKGILSEVKVTTAGTTLLKIVNVADSEKVNIVAEDSIQSYFARPFREE